jgi:hypothetical protein
MSKENGRDASATRAAMNARNSLAFSRPTEDRVFTATLNDEARFDHLLDNVTPTQQCVLLYGFFLFDHEKGKPNWAEVGRLMGMSRQAVDNQLAKIRTRAQSLGLMVEI